MQNNSTAKSLLLKSKLDIGSNVVISSRCNCAIVALAQRPWHGQRMLPQQVISRLAARGWHILYSTGPLSLWDRKQPEWSHAPWLGRFEQVDSLTVFHAGRLTARLPSVGHLDRLALALFARQLRSQIPHTNLVCYVMHPSYLPMLESLRPHHVVYHARDRWSLVPDMPPNVVEQEAELVKRADLIVAASKAIAEALPADGALRARVLENGADFASYVVGPKKPLPEDLRTIPRPRIGYTGSVNLKVDLSVVVEIAGRMPNWHWVFVGKVFSDRFAALPDNDPQKSAWHQFQLLPNIHLLGFKHYSALPAYVGHMDVNVMCYRTKGGWWEAGYPLKLHEYLAAGTPTIGSDLASIRPFSHVVDIPTSTEGWIAAIQKALTKGGVGTPEQRRAVAKENSWDDRVDRLEGWLCELVRAKELSR